MMEEVVDSAAGHTDPEITSEVNNESVIQDALQDAAQTSITASVQLPDNRSAPLNSVPAPPSSSVLLTASPAPLPASLLDSSLNVSGLSLNAAQSEYSQHTLPPFADPSVPPPPTMGFIPAHGVVSANPPKHPVMSVTQDAVPSHIFTPTENMQQFPVTEDINRGVPSAISYAAPQTVPAYGQGVAMSVPYENEHCCSEPHHHHHHHEVQSSQKQEGLFGWMPGSGLMNKMLEKTKQSVESVITTLDPGMKEVIYSGGSINIVVTSTKEVKVGAVRQAFQTVFGRATVQGMESQPNIAPQPVGYSSGVRGAEERIENLRQSGAVDENQVFVSAENFIVELVPDSWFDVGCVTLKDPRNNIQLTTFSQATAVPADYIYAVQDATPQDYPLRWSGLAMTVGQAIQQREPHVNHTDWHLHFTGVSRSEMLASATRSLAGSYKLRLESMGHVF